MCVKAEELIINLVDSLPFKRFPAQQGGMVGGCHRCVGVSKFFTKCYHIDRGMLLQYKLIYTNRMYIVLKIVPEYRYPLYYGKF